ncbi:MAG: photosystem I reaction center subunit XI, partial [Pseudomonadota bacterium]
PLNSSGLSQAFISNLPAYRQGLSAQRRGLEVGMAHGYLLLSFAAGLFVQPDPGPVLANTGLADLVFQKPVSAGDSIRVELTVKRKTRRTETYGEVRWHVALFNQDDEPVATYTLFTMNAY